MRVAFVASEYPPFVYGGLGTHVAALAEALSLRGVSVDIVLPRRGGYRTPPPGVRLREVPTPRAHEAGGNVELWTAFATAAAAELDRGGPVDLVHCHDWMASVTGAAAALRRDLPALFSVHLPQAEHPHVELEALGLAAASVTIVAGEAVLGELRDREPALGEVAVIPNGVDTALYRPSPPRADGDPSVLFVGRLVAQKGVDILLRAFGLVRHRLPDARLVVVGDGDQALYLRRLARYLGLMPRVRFAGWQTGPELVRRYGEADVVAVPSRYEPFGLVALEAMSCARPVVASRVGGLAEIVRDDPTGVLVPPGDHLRLAQAVTGLLLDRPRREEAGRAARERALRSEWSGVAAATLAAYERALRRPRPAAEGIHRAAERVLGALPEPSKAAVAAALGVDGRSARR